MTAEHVIPDWTRDYISAAPAEVGDHTRTVISAGRPTEVRSYRGQAATLTVRRVCASCNNGWMSDLEHEAKPFVETMIQNHRRTYYEHGRQVIATWCLKTSLMAGAAFRANTPPAPLYRDLFEHRKPTGRTRVWLAQTMYPYAHWSDVRPLRTTAAGHSPPIEVNAFSGVLAVGAFAAVTIAWTDAEASADRMLQGFGPALVPIWPQAARAVEWPPAGGALDFDQLDALADSIANLADMPTEGA